MGAQRALRTRPAAHPQPGLWRGEGMSHLPAYIDDHPDFADLALLGLRIFEEAFNQSLGSGCEAFSTLTEYVEAHASVPPLKFASSKPSCGPLAKSYALHLIGHMLSRVERARRIGPSPLGYGAEFIESLLELGGDGSLGAARSIAREMMHEIEASHMRRARMIESAVSFVECGRLAAAARAPSQGPSRTCAPARL